MKRISHRHPRIAIAVAFLLVMAPGVIAEDDTVLVEDSDPAMNAAIKKARHSLPYFWEHMAKPGDGENEFSIKLGLTDGTSTEHFWCNEIDGRAEQATCEIANEPVLVKNVKLGQRVDIAPPRVSDWMFYRNGKIVGGETIRALLPKLSKEEADYYRSLLETP